MLQQLGVVRLVLNTLCAYDYTEPIAEAAFDLLDELVLYGNKTVQDDIQVNEKLEFSNDSIYGVLYRSSLKRTTRRITSSSTSRRE